MNSGVSSASLHAGRCWRHNHAGSRSARSPLNRRRLARAMPSSSVAPACDAKLTALSSSSRAPSRPVSALALPNTMRNSHSRSTICRKRAYEMVSGIAAAMGASPRAMEARTSPASARNKPARRPAMVQSPSARSNDSRASSGSPSSSATSANSAVAAAIAPAAGMFPRSALMTTLRLVRAPDKSPVNRLCTPSLKCTAIPRPGGAVAWS